METAFLSSSPYRRFQRIRTLIQAFSSKARLKKVKFAILVYGSGSYGYKKGSTGKFDDIDLLLVAPRDSSVQSFLLSVEDVFLTKLQVSTSHLEKMIAGEWDMCRMYGEVEGVRLGFRIICTDTFLAASSDTKSTQCVRNIATLGHSRIVTDKEWSFKLWRYVPVTLSHVYVQAEGEQLLLVHHHTFSNRKTNLGALGRKLLMSTVVFDPYGCVSAGLSNIFKQTVESALRYRAEISNEEMLNAFYRVERFPEVFRKSIVQKIALARVLL